MKKQIACGVIRDLLPLYVDGVAGEESRALVEEHLNVCGRCRRELEQLRQTVEVPPETNKGDEIKRWKRALNQRTRRGIGITAALLITLVCLLPLFAPGLFPPGLPGWLVERDSRSAREGEEGYALLSQVMNGDIALFLYDKGDDYLLFDIYVNRPGLDFGYHFRYGSSRPASDEVCVVQYRDSILAFSLSPDSGAARVELSAGPGAETDAACQVTPGEYFAVILPSIQDADDAALQILAADGTPIPYTVLVL